ncbi:hypothetical protein B296_00045992 [Ensete ventricosum]|uniref:Uncharacterized protein n=1 Tax=Ensete ventricosum TaxID=4639 RepID=A0A426YBC9_ENSVE|nr:hypothetical protein B296_00045992 [Ensete ventricosum]
MTDDQSQPGTATLQLAVGSPPDVPPHLHLAHRQLGSSRPRQGALFSPSQHVSLEHCTLGFATTCEGIRCAVADAPQAAGPRPNWKASRRYRHVPLPPTEPFTHCHLLGADLLSSTSHETSPGDRKAASTHVDPTCLPVILAHRRIFSVSCEIGNM